MIILSTKKFYFFQSDAISNKSLLHGGLFMMIFSQTPPLLGDFFPLQRDGTGGGVERRQDPRSPYPLH